MRISITTIILLLSLFMASCNQAPKVWNIVDYGAVADSATVSTLAIQQAIDECAQSGGGRVHIPSGNFVTGTILLKNRVELHMASNAVLSGSTNPNDYFGIDSFTDATGQQRGKCMIGAIDAAQISITGNGTIDGNGEFFTVNEIKKTLQKLHLESEASSQTSKENGVFERPFLIRLVRSKGIKITDVILKNSGAWNLHLFQCANFLIDHITITSHVNKNNDGIDIDSSSDGIISNCSIDTGDDALCFKTTSPQPTENIRVKNCQLKSDWGAIKIGTESMGNFGNILISNCQIHDTKGGAIKILSVDGAVIDHVKIDSIQMDQVEMPIFIRLGERLRVYRNAPKQDVGQIRNLEISNIVATTRIPAESRISPSTGIFITGTPNHKIESVKLSNIQISLSGGGKPEDANIEVPENETAYPEFTGFGGALPAYGLFARHISSLFLSNVQFILLSADERQQQVLIDATTKSAPHE